MDAIQRLMGCLAFARRGMPPAYARLMAPGAWEAAEQELSRQFSCLLGLVSPCGL